METELEKVLTLERPHGNLLKYYILTSFLLGPLFPLVLVPLYFKYHTLRYRFDQEGVSMRWGVLFRREVSLNYSRLQDIHLSSNIFERWLGLARVQLQTASGSASAEMTVEGLQEYELVRDFLYTRMRGAKNLRDQTTVPAVAAQLPTGGAGEMQSVVDGLRAVTAELAAIRSALEGTRATGALAASDPEEPS